MIRTIERRDIIKGGNCAGATTNRLRRITDDCEGLSRGRKWKNAVVLEERKRILSKVVREVEGIYKNGSRKERDERYKRADIPLLACTQVGCALQTIRSHSDHLKKVNNN